MVKQILSRFIVRILNKKPLYFSATDVEKAMQNPGTNPYQGLLKKINLRKSFSDEMFNEDGSHYLKVGLSAIQCIDAAIKESDAVDIKRILDLPCGHGRVLRFLTEFFPGAEITACDTNKNAVDFCRQEFSAHGVYSQKKLKTFSLGQKYDLIWCGSLATHLEEDHTRDLLSFFYRHLNPGGLLVFSMHGKRTLEYLTTGEQNYTLDEKRIEQLLAGYRAAGYGYTDYKKHKGYGISLASDEWMKTALERVGEWRNYRHVETSWDNHHDIYSVVKCST